MQRADYDQMQKDDQSSGSSEPNQIPTFASPLFLVSCLPQPSLLTGKPVQNPYKSDHFRECDFFNHSATNTYNFNALKCTDSAPECSYDPNRESSIQNCLIRKNTDDFKNTPSTTNMTAATYQTNSSGRPDAILYAERKYQGAKTCSRRRRRLTSRFALTRANTRSSRTRPRAQDLLPIRTE